MTRSVSILSSDAVFARMLELECIGMGLSATVETEGSVGGTDLILWDMDTVPPSVPSQSGVPVIGYTKGLELSHVDTERLCTMILHRPFEMRLFRREVRGLLEDASQTTRATETIRLQGNTLYVGQGSVALSPKEALVMQCLMENRPLAVSRETLAARIGESSANKVEVYVCYLRKKTETLCRQRLIRTVRGVGYSLAEQT